MMPFAAEVARAQAAQAVWATLDVRERSGPIRLLRDLIARRADELVEAVRQDIGRPAVEVLGSELLPAAAALQFLERRASRILSPRRVGGSPIWLMGCRDVVHRRPWGVVGVIGTWNYPLFLNVGPIAQALIAGNAVLWKPSENGPRSAELVHSLFLQAGFSPDLFQRLPATREAGPDLAEAAIDHVVFTGSDGVGRKLAARLGERLIPSTMELSGCDAMFVLADANLDLAARAAWFGFTLNRGQTCIAVRRIFVNRQRYAAFEEAIRKLNPRSNSMHLVTPGQVAQWRRLIDEAVSRGARAVSFAEGSSAGPEMVVPTLLFDAPADAAICREACFSPVAAVIPFDRIEDAIEQARLCTFGLSSSIFTSRMSQAQALAAQVRAGSVIVNDVIAPTANPSTPFGGRGTSGWGVTQGAEGLLGMTVPQVVTVRSGAFRPHYDEALTPDPATVELLGGLLRLKHSGSIRRKISGLWQMLRGIRRRR